MRGTYFEIPSTTKNLHNARNLIKNDIGNERELVCVV